MRTIETHRLKKTDIFAILIKYAGFNDLTPGEKRYYRNKFRHIINDPDHITLVLNELFDVVANMLVAEHDFKDLDYIEIHYKGGIFHYADLPERAQYPGLICEITYTYMLTE
jgi:hypothetical protein